MKKTLKLLLPCYVAIALSTSIASEQFDDDNDPSQYHRQYFIEPDFIEPDVKSKKEWINSESRRFSQDQESGNLFPFKYYQYMKNRNQRKYPPEYEHILRDPSVHDSLEWLLLRD